MRTEEVLVQLVFSNQMLFCGVFGALGGVVHSLDLSSDISLGGMISKVIISASAGILLFFSTYDISLMTPALRIAASIVSGFYGSALFRYLARLYLKQGAGMTPAGKAFTRELEKVVEEEKGVREETAEKENHPTERKHPYPKAHKSKEIKTESGGAE